MSLGFEKGKSWGILSPIEAALKRKIEAIGTPLKEWNVQINRGILTGLNEAFIIDSKTKDELISKSPKNAEIIRPIILGKNIKRYCHAWQDTWLINSHNGIKAKNIAPIDLEVDYPSIYSYLCGFLPQIKGRADQGDKWYNLRNCSYLEEFDIPKIVWGNLAIKNQFAFISEPIIVNNPSNFISTDSLFLLGILNSKLADYYIKQLGVMRNGGYFEYKPMFVGQIPIPNISDDIQVSFNSIVSKIMDLRSQNINTASLEKEVDAMVYKLYGLTTDEANIINRS